MTELERPHQIENLTPDEINRLYSAQEFPAHTPEDIARIIGILAREGYTPMAGAVTGRDGAPKAALSMLRLYGAPDLFSGDVVNGPLAIARSKDTEYYVDARGVSVWKRNTNESSK